MKKTKIICSIGPASNNPDIMEEMVNKGMNVARINFTHATLEEKNMVISSVLEVRKRTNKPVAILYDTRGPEFRCGEFEGGSVTLVEGETIKIVKENVLGNSKRFSVNHPKALDSINVGNYILLENAKMKVEVIDKDSEGLICKIINGGVLGNKKSISAPGVKLDIPYVGEKDLEDLKYAFSHDGEYLAISFVSSKEDVLEIRNLMHEYKRDDLQIICKIESELGIKNLDEILSVADGVMIARGDLGTEIPSEMLPVIQKEIISKCRRHGKLCVVATEMLETMMEENRPKRAETSDIANAVLDGTDAVMLSGETTVGKHPIETVEEMAKICEATEKYAQFDYLRDRRGELSDIPTAICESVVGVSNRLKAKAICANTISGQTAKTISNLKPDALILALCPNAKVGRQLALYYGVFPIDIPLFKTTDEILTESVYEARKFIPLNKGDLIITTGSFPHTGMSTPTNLLKIEEIE